MCGTLYARCSPDIPYGLHELTARRSYIDDLGWMAVDMRHVDDD